MNYMLGLWQRCRLPGYRRYELEAAAHADGIEISEALAREIDRLAA